MKKERVRIQNLKTGQILGKPKTVIEEPWLKNNPDWIVLNDSGIKKESEPVEVEAVELSEENTTEVIEGETIDSEIEELKLQIKDITGRKPRTNDIEKLRTQLNELNNDGI